jgi:hypothetical protein
MIGELVRLIVIAFLFPAVMAALFLTGPRRFA